MKSRRNRELYRIPNKGKVAGVCAGVAEYFGWEAWLVRILVVSGVLLGMAWFIVIYIAGWFILDKQPVNAAHNAVHGQANETSAQAVNTAADEPIKVKARIWQAGEPPRQAFHDIRRKFQSLESQLQSMERYVTSPEFTVSREINRL
ncbi:envelope stress response membrane protein PspC [Endozoicomonas sp. G2_1]|uniref:envelope stress response membrane protein PspC n=1 Tax=Endozoicomonas sp. G2_1 TaxID=2821091 RepID=UPI001ADA9A1F|nr:envelope stress response membrane protein PspC [Endozoicomonas sp. G2_1]MBO9491506.1 envelope stress response membrane protein PspC [Endozoicomonas sp. G2_1]